jgi:uncharacterized protein YndB with AHSA1/START domain
MKERSTRHGTFTIERRYPATPARVFAAWSDPAAKARWFSGADGWHTETLEFDFSVGGRERVRTGPLGGKVHCFDCTYQDIVPEERIIYSYDMHIAEARISVSLATVELKPERAHTRLIFTEQAVYLDDFDDGGGRERGTQELLDKLGRLFPEA